MLFASFVGLLYAGEVRGAVDESPLPFKTVRAFPELQFDRPIVVTYAPDGTNRLFVGGPERARSTCSPTINRWKRPRCFWTSRPKWFTRRRKTKRGCWAWRFIPTTKQNGEFFIYYTTTAAEHTSVISRFRVSKDDPNKADPDFEEEVMRIKQPFWNHNGGTIEFGPDGYLYIGLGDGGKANDPFKNGQNLETLLGSILRIDVDHKDPGKGYAIPKDNPFVGKKNARPEIWAYGLRNVWRLAFDRKTGTLWAGDVGQDLWEEIDIIKKGGNYGWNVREASASLPARQPILQERLYRSHLGVPSHHRQIHHRRPRVSRQEVSPARGLLHLRRLRHRQEFGASSTMRKPKPSPPTAPSPAANCPIMSFGEDADGEIYLTTPFGVLYTLGPMDE